MTVTKENIKEHLDIYMGAFLDAENVTQKKIEKFAKYLDDIIVDKIKAKDYRISSETIKEYRYNVINILVTIPIEKTKTIIPDNVDFGMIDDEIGFILNKMYDYKIEFDIAARMNEHCVKFDIAVTPVLH